MASFEVAGAGHQKPRDLIGFEKVVRLLEAIATLLEKNLIEECLAKQKRGEIMGEMVKRGLELSRMK
jgi:hypothetical protein